MTNPQLLLPRSTVCKLIKYSSRSLIDRRLSQANPKSVRIKQLKRAEPTVREQKQLRTKPTIAKLLSFSKIVRQLTFTTSLGDHFSIHGVHLFLSFYYNFRSKSQDQSVRLGNSSKNKIPINRSRSTKHSLKNCST